MDPRCADVADQLLLIEQELRGMGWWAEESPSAVALASQAPFCVDALGAFDRLIGGAS
jgi:uncharacterized protein YqcC (DUF446 family)